MDFEHPTEWGEACAWKFLIKLSNLMQNIFTDFEHPTPKHPKVSKKSMLTYFAI